MAVGEQAASLLCMLRLRIVCLVMAAMLSRTGWNQTDAHALELELQKEDLALRSYSAEPVARYEWVNNTLVAKPGHLFTLGAFKTKFVKLQGSTVLVEGARYTLVKDSKKTFSLMSGGPMKLEIDLHNAAPEKVFPQLKEMLFIPTVDAAIAGLPAPLPTMLPFDISDTPQLTKCNCRQFYVDGHWIEISSKYPHFSNPKMVHAEETKLTEEARRERVTGVIRLWIYVNNAGLVEDVWIARPLGFGLDKQAAIALRGSTFKPAQYDEQAVGTFLFVETKFQSE